MPEPSETKMHTVGKLRVGYRDGSGMDTLVSDTKEGEAVAVVRWGCSCCKFGDEPDPQQEANAARLALCWNSHDELVEYARLEEEYSQAVNRLRPGWKSTDAMDWFNKYGIDPTYPAGKWLAQKRLAALKLAQGGPK